MTTLECPLSDGAFVFILEQKRVEINLNKAGIEDQPMNISTFAPVISPIQNDSCGITLRILPDHLL